MMYFCAYIDYRQILYVIIYRQTTRTEGQTQRSINTLIENKSIKDAQDQQFIDNEIIGFIIYYSQSGYSGLCSCLTLQNQTEFLTQPHTYTYMYGDRIY